MVKGGNKNNVVHLRPLHITFLETIIINMLQETSMSMQTESNKNVIGGEW